MQKDKINDAIILSLPLILKMDFNIQSSPSDFYEWFSDFNHYPLIFDHVIRFDKVGEKSEGRYIETARTFMGTEEQYEVRIIETIPSRLITVAVSNSRIMGYFRFAFSPVNNGTRFTIAHYTSHKNPFIVSALRLGLWLLFINRQRRAEIKLREIFKT